MSSLEVALVAEGAGELGRSALRYAPGDVISPDDHGPGHELVQRICVEAAGLPEEAALPGRKERAIPWPESRPPGSAKETLQRWTSEAGADGRATRLTLARTARLDGIANKCPSFGQLRRDLTNALRNR